MKGLLKKFLQPRQKDKNPSDSLEEAELKLPTLPEPEKKPPESEVPIEKAAKPKEHFFDEFKRRLDALGFKVPTKVIKALREYKRPLEDLVINHETGVKIVIPYKLKDYRGWRAEIHKKNRVHKAPIRIRHPNFWIYLEEAIEEQSERNKMLEIFFDQLRQVMKRLPSDIQVENLRYTNKDQGVLTAMYKGEKYSLKTTLKGRILISFDGYGEDTIGIPPEQLLTMIEVLDNLTIDDSFGWRYE